MSQTPWPPKQSPYRERQPAEPWTELPTAGELALFDRLCAEYVRARASDWFRGVGEDSEREQAAQRIAVRSTTIAAAIVAARRNLLGRV